MARKPEPRHRRRTEDELSKALVVIESKRDLLHVNADDEYVDTLGDAVNELLALRAITARLMQQVGTARQEAERMLKNMFS